MTLNSMRLASLGDTLLTYGFNDMLLQATIPDFARPGLTEGTVYDAIPMVPGTTGTAAVNVTDFLTRCSTPNVTHTGSRIVNMTAELPEVLYNFTIATERGDIWFETTMPSSKSKSARSSRGTIFIRTYQTTILFASREVQ